MDKDTNSLDYKAKYNQAVSLLKSVLLDSGIENDFDENIYDYLKENNELPADYTPYWINVEE